VLIASVIVCVLYLAWVLGLSELSVAMPFAGGPLAYGRRAVGKWFGFLMGWSMFLECLFATFGTALATGGYLAFLLNPAHPSRLVTTAAAIACALVFFVIQYRGVKEQAVIMLWLTYAAIGALVCFWIAAVPGVSFTRVFTTPLLPSGWSGALGAVPYALWWLVIIETVALASEEAHTPQVSIPRGMVLAQITLVVLVLFTWFFACAAAPFKETGAVDYPLPLVLRNVWGDGWFLTVFSAFALAGMVVSYNGMLYATSRQSFSLGRAGYLPTALGAVHPVTRTPHVSLIVWTIATIAFVVFAQWYQNATAAAILISTLAAVVWYVLAMICLYILRRKEPHLERPYRVPVYPYLPAFVAILSAMAAFLYTWANVKIILPTAALYLGAMVWYFARGRHRVLPVAPEEVAARIAEELARPKPVQAAAAVEPSAAVTTIVNRPTGPILLPSDPLYSRQARTILERLAVPLLLLGPMSLLWMVLRAAGILPPVFAERNEVLLFGALWTALFVLLSLVGLLSTRGTASDQLNTSADSGRSPRG